MDPEITALLDEVRRLDAQAPSRVLRAFREGNAPLSDGTLVGLSRLDGIEAPYSPQSLRERNPRALYMRDEDADFHARSRTLLPALARAVEELLAERTAAAESAHSATASHFLVDKQRAGR